VDDALDGEVGDGLRLTCGAFDGAVKLGWIRITTRSAAVTDKAARQINARPTNDAVMLKRRPLRHAPIPVIVATDNARQAKKTKAFSGNVETGRKTNPTAKRQPKTVRAKPTTT
jgi:hypothetical protein